MIQPARYEDSNGSTPIPDGDSVLEDLIEECTNRLQAGEPIDLDELAARHPEHAERLRRLLPSLCMMAEVGRTATGPLPPVLPPEPPLGPPQPTRSSWAITASCGSSAGARWASSMRRSGSRSTAEWP